MIKKFLIGFFVSVLIFPLVIGFLVYHFYLMPDIRNRRIEKVSALHLLLPQINKDIQVLTADPIFPTMGKVKNADDYFSKHLSWDGDGIASLDAKLDEKLENIFATA